MNWVILPRKTLKALHAGMFRGNERRLRYSTKTYLTPIIGNTNQRFLGSSPKMVLREVSPELLPEKDRNAAILATGDETSTSSSGSGITSSQ
jgi:hypothetical protein